MSTQARQPSDRDPGVGERVRFCLECGEVLPFDAVRCPGCGTLESMPPAPGARSTSGEQGTCPACGAARPENLLFCPRCGVEFGAPAGVARAGLVQATERQATVIAGLSTVLALLAPLCALLVVLQLLLPGRLG